GRRAASALEKPRATVAGRHQTAATVGVARGGATSVAPPFRWSSWRGPPVAGNDRADRRAKRRTHPGEQRHRALVASLARRLTGSHEAYFVRSQDCEDFCRSGA